MSKFDFLNGLPIKHIPVTPNSYIWSAPKLREELLLHGANENGFAHGWWYRTKEHDDNRIATRMLHTTGVNYSLKSGIQIYMGSVGTPIMIQHLLRALDNCSNMCVVSLHSEGLVSRSFSVSLTAQGNNIRLDPEAGSIVDYEYE